MPTTSKASISPSQANVMPSLGQFFEFSVNGESILAEQVKWEVSTNPNVGTIGRDGRFVANEKRLNSWGVIKGTLMSDHSITAEATVNILINWASSEGTPVLVDNWSFPGFEGTLWNDARGRRAWLVMMDILHQLQAQDSTFLEKVGHVAIVRTTETFADKLKSTRSLHWPFDRRAVIFPNNVLLDPNFLSDDLTDNEDFAKTFFHEMSHAVLANKAFGSGDRFFHSMSVEVTSWLTSTFRGISTLVGAVFTPVSAILGAIIPANRDFLSDYADVGGWVVNGMRWMNPLLGFLDTQSPDVVTGLAIVGNNPTVHLRNKKLPEKFTAADLKKAGFPDEPGDALYPATDVHEDWACSLTYLAFNPDWETTRPEFAPRAQFLYRNKIWKKGNSLKCGGYLNQDAIDSQPHTDTPILPDPRKWAVAFGAYAGKPVKSTFKVAPKSLKQSQRKFADVNSAPSPHLNAAGVDPLSADSPAAPGDSVVDDQPYLGEGGESSDEESPFQDDIEEFFQKTDVVARYADADAKFVAAIEPVYEMAVKQISALPVLPSDSSAIAFLRSAEGYGEGVVFLAGHPEYKFRPADFAMSTKGDLWMIVDVDANDAVKTAACASSFGETLPKNTVFNPKILVYAWSNDRPLRIWLQSCPSEYHDLNNALRRLVLCWGDTGDDGKRDLSKPANLLMELLDAGQINIPSLTKRQADWSLDDIQSFCDKYGAGTVSAKDLSPLMPGDVVSLTKPERLGVVLSVQSDLKTLEVLVNGGDDVGLVGEDENSAKVVHSVRWSLVSWYWRPSALAKKS